MSIKVIKGNLLEANSESIILTIDGSAEGMEGNIARLFDKKWSEAWEDIEDNMVYPIGLGSTILIELDKEIVCNFKYALVASTLHHKETLQKEEMCRVVSKAFSNAINLASRAKIPSLATAVMTGGWRLPTSEAFKCMLDSYKSIQLSLSYILVIKIYTISDDDFNMLQNMAKDLGVLYKSSKNSFIVE